MVGFKLILLGVAHAAKQEDLITSLPGFEEAWNFSAYSGFLEVPGPINGYDKLLIHYQFHTSLRGLESEPVVAWHNGGPGASSISAGLYGEMGAFIIGESGNYLNKFAWNRVANMLYLDSPAGVGNSQCVKDGSAVECHWDDVTQAEAYANTLLAFYRAFPEFSTRDLYLTGESYAGQYVPNIAHYILNNAPFNSTLHLRGLALGNACWGEHQDGDIDGCNGPNEHRNDVELFFGKGLISPKLHEQLYKACSFPDVSGKDCQQALAEMSREMGPYNVYNLYDNCPNTQQFLSKIGKDARWLTRTLRAGLHDSASTHQALTDLNGGFKWDCLGDVSAWLDQEDVRKALHLDALPRDGSRFHYRRAGPSALSLYPELAKKLRILIYNGDADACVPYVGNEEWIDGLEAKGVLSETSSWAPWFSSSSAPAGYVTEYSVADSKEPFWFATIRLAGHEAPTYQPEASFDMFSRWLAGEHLISKAVHPAALV